MNMMPPYLVSRIRDRLERHKKLIPNDQTENFLPGDPALAIFSEKIKGRASELEWLLNIIHTTEKDNEKRKTKVSK